MATMKARSSIILFLLGLLCNSCIVAALFSAQDRWDNHTTTEKLDKNDFDDTYPFRHHRQSPGQPGFVVRDAQRISLDAMDRTEFQQRFARRNLAQPLVISDVFEGDTFDETQWTREAIAKECGHYSIYLDPTCKRMPGGGRFYECHSVRQHNPESVAENFASLDVVDVQKEGISTFGDFLNAQETEEGYDYYLFNAQLAKYCPTAMKRVQYPYYLAPNYQFLSYEPDRTLPERQADCSFGLFLGKEGTGTALHTDSDMESTWSQAMSGRKLWRLFPPSEYWRLYPVEGQEESYFPELFYPNVMEPDFDKFPLLNGALMYEALLEPGEGILVPQGWSHQVLNLDDAVTFAVAAMQWHDILGQREYYKHQYDYQVDYYNEERSRYENAFFFPLDPFEFKDDKDDDQASSTSRRRHISFEEMVNAHHLTQPEDWTMDTDKLHERVPKTVKDLVDSMAPNELDAFRSLVGDPMVLTAVEFHFVSVLRFLVEVGGANINEVSRTSQTNGETALDVAIASNFYRLAQFLVDHYQAKTREELQAEVQQQEQHRQQPQGKELKDENTSHKQGGADEL